MPGWFPLQSVYDVKSVSMPRRHLDMSGHVKNYVKNASLEFRFKLNVNDGKIVVELVHWSSGPL